MKKRYTLLLIILTAHLNIYSQENEYIKTSEMKGIPSLLKRIAPFESTKQYFTFFNFESTAYDLLFYKNLVQNRNSNSAFIKLNLMSTKPLIIEPKAFPNYKFILNPKIEKGLVSKQRLSINVREDAITTSFETTQIEIVFPENILQNTDNQTVSAIVDINNEIKHNNSGNLNTAIGLEIKGIKGFSMAPSTLSNSFISLLKTEDAQIKYINNEKSNTSLFEDNRVFNFVNAYQKLNGRNRMQTVDNYKSAILLKHVTGEIKLNNAIEYRNSEIYFFKNIISGVLEFSPEARKKLLKDIQTTFKITNLSFKSNGDFPTIIKNHKNTYFKIEQDFRSIRLYFIIVN